MAANGISTLPTKEARQIAKLDLAALKREQSYDIDLLPTKYNGNTLVNNPNVGGLQPGRPWTTGTPGLTPYPQRTNYAFDFITPPTSGALWNDDVNQVSIAINGTAVRDSNYGRGIVFNGIDTHLIINNITDGISTLTLSMAADFQSAGTYWNSVYHGGSYGSNDIFAYIGGGNTDSIAVGTVQNFDTTGPIVNNVLAWWEFVYSGTSVKVYKNGVEVTDGTLSNANTGFTSALLIGKRYDSDTDFLNGTIYRIKGALSALTPAQVAAQYNSIRLTYSLPEIPAPVSGSISISNTSSRVTMSPGLAVGSTTTSPFTVEGWFYSTVNPGTDSGPVLLSTTTGSGTPAYAKALTVNVSSSTQVVVDSNGAAATAFDFTQTMVINAWYYLAVSRDTSGYIQVWMAKKGDATAAASTTGRFDSAGAGAAWELTGLSDCIGAFVPANRFTTGYISNLRVTNTNLYTTTNATIAVPTAPFTEVTGTVLLVNDTTLTDQTGNQALTAVGSTVGSTADPFDNLATYTAVTPNNGTTPGSVYFLRAEYPGIENIPVGALMTGPIFPDPNVPVTITVSQVWVNQLYWFVNYSSIPSGTRDTLPGDTFVFTW